MEPFAGVLAFQLPCRMWLPVRNCLDAICIQERDRMRILRRLTVPASESQMAVILSVSMVVMALLLCAVLWQSNVISYQRDLIYWLWNGKFNG